MKYESLGTLKIIIGVMGGVGMVGVLGGGWGIVDVRGGDYCWGGSS